jgi:hypothetical protein
MVEKPTSGRLFGVPYNFERPTLRRMLSTYWQPDEGMLVEKPFGVGYTLNMANWRSWVVLAITLALWWQSKGAGTEGDEDEDAVDVVVED